MSTLFQETRWYFYLFFFPSLGHLFLGLRTIANKKAFANRIEKYNELGEYLISYYELSEKSAEFKKAIEKRLFELLSNKKVKIPFSIHVIYVALLSLTLLEVFILVFTMWSSPYAEYTYFSRAKYVAFVGEGIELILEGKKLPDSLYVKNKDFKEGILVKGKEVYVKAPSEEGIYLLTCSQCLTSLLIVKPYPYIVARGYVEEKLQRKKRELSVVDYVLKGSHISLRLKSYNTDSVFVKAGDFEKRFVDSLRFSFNASEELKIQAGLFVEDRKVDTLLYMIHVVEDEPPEVVILYPENTINPVFGDTERVIAYLRDDIGLSEGIGVLYAEGFKRLVFEKKYDGQPIDTVQLSLSDLVGPLRDEVKLRLIAIDVGGKRGFAEVVFRKPTYNERLKEFMSLRDSIMGSGDESEESLAEFDLKIKEMRNLNNVEREKLEKELERNLKEVEKLKKNMENIRKIAENLKELTQDQELLETLEEFNKTFLKLLDKKMQDLMKELYQKNKVDSFDSEKLAKYLESIRKNKSELVKQLKRLKQFMEELKKALDQEEFVERFEDILNRERLLREKTKYFKNIKDLASEQNAIKMLLDSIATISPEMWEKYSKELKETRNIMGNIEKLLNKEQRNMAQKSEEKLIHKMTSMSDKMKNDLRKERQRRKTSALLKIKQLKYNLFFLNIATSPFMSQREKVLYRDGLSLSLSVTDSLDAITYIRLFKAISLIRMAKEYVLTRSSLAYGLVNQAILDLLKKQNSIRDGGGQGTRNEIEEMLKKLLSKQSSLTKEVAGMLPMPMPLPQGSESILSELGRMQEELRKMAEKLARMGEGKQGKELKEAIKEMKKAEEELKEGVVSENTIEHQRKALKHLLTAYRSIRKKELSRKRVSTPGKSFVPDIPEIPLELQLESLTETLLRKAMEAGFFGDPFVREYIYNLKQKNDIRRKTQK